MNPQLDTNRNPANEAEFQRTWTQRVADRIFGFDFFISYAWKDGRPYAIALARQLEKAGFDCFLDSDDYSAGDDWKQIGAWALRKTTRLVLIGTPAALESKPVQRELTLYAARGRRIIPVDLGGCLRHLPEDHPFVALLPESVLRVEESPDRSTLGPSEEVVSRIRQCFEGERQTEKRHRWVRRVTWSLTAALLIAVVLGALAGVQTRRARVQQQIALSRQLAAQALSQLERDHDRALLIAAEASRVADTTEARRSLLTALGANPAVKSYLHHTGEVLSVAFGPDGQTLVTGCEDQRIYLWNLNTGQPEGPPLTAHAERPVSLAFSPDGKVLAAGFGDSTTVLWEMPSRRLLGTLSSQNETKGLYSWSRVTMSPDGKTLAAGNSGPEIHRWDLTTRQPLGPPMTNASYPINTLAFSPDGRWLAAGSEGRFGKTEGILSLWDMTTQRPYSPDLTGLRNVVNWAAFSPDGKTFAASTVDNDAGSSHESVILFWEVPTWRPLDLVLTNREVSSFAFSPDSKFLAVAWGQYFYPQGETKHAAISLYDLTSPRRPLRETFVGHKGGIKEVAFSRDGQLLASAGADGKVILWKVQPQHPLGEPLVESSSPFSSVAFSPDGKRLATATMFGRLEIIDLVTRKPIGPKEPDDPFPENRIWSLAFHPNGKSLALGARWGENNHCVLLWDIEAGKLGGPPMLGHTGEVSSVAFHPQGRMFASGSQDRTTIVWDAATQQPIGQPITGHLGPVNCIAFSRDGRYFASGDDQGRIILRQAETHAPLGPPLEGHQSGVSSLAFSLDGRLLASGSKDSTIVFWDMDTRQPLGSPLTGHSANVATLAFSPDGKLLVSASADIETGNPNDTLIFWDVASRQALAPPLRAHDNRIRSVAFSPDGTTLASASDDTWVKLWDLRLETWRQRARGIANRDFTPDEARQFIGLKP